MVDRLRRIPAWGWLAAIVVISFAFRAWLARGMVAPFIFVDELIYAELARSLADSGQRLVRDVPTTGYGIGYPLLISPAYALFDRLPDAYAAVKTINALLMSLAAVPAYLLARRLVGEWWALAAAVLAVAIPSMAYTGTVMTENAFYPLFLLIAWQLARVLERPTAVGQVLLLVLIAVAYTIRVQALVLVPAALTAPILLALFERRRSTLRPFLAAYGIVVAGGAAIVALQLARGHDVSGLLGAYSVVGEGGYDTRLVLDYLVWHLAELDLYVAVLPVAATLVLLANVGRLPRRLQEHLAVTVALTSWLGLAVAAFASRFAANRIQERNFFVVAPLLLICLVAWVERGAPRPRIAALAAAATAALAPLLIPFERFIETGVVSDTLALVALWRLYGNLIADSVEWTVAVAGVALGCLFLLVPRRWTPALPGDRPGRLRARFPAGLVGEHAGRRRAWLQGRIGRCALSGNPDSRPCLDRRRRRRRARFGALVRCARPFRREPERVLQSLGRCGLRRRRADPRRAGGDPGDEANVRRHVSHRRGQGSARAAVLRGRLDRARRGGGRARPRARDDPVARGRPARRDDDDDQGLYPNDTWSGKSVNGRANAAWRHARRHDRERPALFKDDQIVTASIGGRAVARARVAPTGRRTLRSACAPSAGRAGSSSRSLAPGCPVRATPESSAPTSPSCTAREDCVRRQPALPSATGIGNYVRARSPGWRRQRPAGMS